MTDKLDQFIDSLQEEINQEARQVLGEKGFHRWQNPRFRGSLEHFDVHAHTLGDCGDSMDIYLEFDGEKVKNASYVTDGCGSSNVCGSFAAELSMGRQVEELADITGELILSRLGNVPEDEKHCAFLAAGTVQEALRIYMTRGTDNEKREQPGPS
ncbi:iron-sulfur cluster assembly scaffold protein [Desulfospira joergensenii]|uniref:iron-sulfur cluster assembly scaffold protein n=1 Tax=Desulfospira joergensenii TaxID=53329 RepID=UPI0003B5CCB5|nr:iron-sulfur cluster assembly scaffold protein [Desulfospira joergensenii]